MPHRDSGRNKERKLPPLRGKRFEVRGRIWLDGREGTFLGRGRVALMERIKEHGSITKAAKAEGMSYRHAWRLIDSMNRQSPKPFVVMAQGGRNGGGAAVTEHGERAIRLFERFSREFREFLQMETENINLERDI